jgi:two-component system invasion response regulator UvrY
VEFIEVQEQEQAAKLTREGKWDLVLLDFPSPTSQVLELLREVRQAPAKAPVLVVGNDPEHLNAKWAFRAGANGFVGKNAQAKEIATAARRVFAGHRYVSPSLAEELAWELVKHSGKPPHDHLSQRELEVLRLLASGRTVTEIAGDLGLSVRTVSTYRARILDKMEMRTNADLIRYALQNGLAQ